MSGAGAGRRPPDTAGWGGSRKCPAGARRRHGGGSGGLLAGQLGECGRGGHTDRPGPGERAVPGAVPPPEPARSPEPGARGPSPLGLPTVGCGRQPGPASGLTPGGAGAGLRRSCSCPRSGEGPRTGRAVAAGTEPRPMRGMTSGCFQRPCRKCRLNGLSAWSGRGCRGAASGLCRCRGPCPDRVCLSFRFPVCAAVPRVCCADVVPTARTRQ